MRSNQFRLLKAEFLKTKRTSIFIFHLSLAIVSVGSLFIYFFFKTRQELLNEKLFEANPNPWFIYYGNYLFLFVIFLPVIISVTAFLVKNIEDRADGWKRLYVLPYGVETLHMAKLLIIITYVTIYLLATYFLLSLSSFILAEFKSDFEFYRFNPLTYNIFIFFVKFEIAAVSIITSSYALFISLKRNTASLLFSIFLPFFGLTFTSQYSSPFNQWTSYTSKRTHMIINSIQGYDDLKIALVDKYDIINLLVLIISLCIIVYASKKPIISYD